MSQANEDKKAREVFSKIGKRVLTAEDKRAALRKNTGWNEPKLRRVIERIEKEDA